MLYSKRRKNLGGGLENAPPENLIEKIVLIHYVFKEEGLTGVLVRSSTQQSTKKKKQQKKKQPRNLLKLNVGGL